MAFPPHLPLFHGKSTLFPMHHGAQDGWIEVVAIDEAHFVDEGVVKLEMAQARAPEGE